MEEGIKRQIEEFSSKLVDRLDDSNFTADHNGYLVSMDLDEIANLVGNKDVVTCEEATMPNVEQYTNMSTKEHPDKYDEEAIDQCLTAELILGLGTDGERVGRVIKRSWRLDKQSIGMDHLNPLFDTHTYSVEFTDGSVERYQANVTAENMFAQVDEEGHQFWVLIEITDPRKDASAIPMTDGMIRPANSQMTPNITTRG
eukprot:14567333-Ditylum_brightwellii.AAC.3